MKTPLFTKETLCSAFLQKQLDEKQTLRTGYKQKRKSLTPSTINSLSLEITNQALKLPIWEASFYHLYLTIKHLKEVETEPLLSVLYGRDKNIIISKSDILNGEMSYYLLKDNTTIKPNIWNIPEPPYGLQIKASKLEVIFVPFLVFDKVGRRFGYGKGFYDGFLKNCPNTVKIGLFFFEADKKIKDIQPNDIVLLSYTKSDLSILKEDFFEVLLLILHKISRPTPILIATSATLKTGLKNVK